MINVLAFASAQSSPAYHRIILPLGLIKDMNVLVTNNLLDEQFEGVNVFMYSRVLHDEHIKHIYELRRKHGFKIVLDIDDYWLLDEHHVSYNHYKEIGFAKLQTGQLTQADAVFTTNARLAGEVATYNANVHVLPNAIPKFAQFIRYRPKPSRACRIFWQGSDTHLEDLRLLTFVFKNAPVTDATKYVLAGYNVNSPVWREMSYIYTDNGRLPHIVIDAMHYTNYYQAYEEADVCLVPLLNSKFNSMKSNLKVLEAANLALPVIAHDVNPYKDMPVIYAKGSRDWLTWIGRLSKSSKRRREYGLELQAFCKEHFNFDKINLERKQILEHEAK